MTRLSSRRKDSSTAFLIHWCVIHSPPCFLGDAQLAGVQAGDDFLDRLAQGLRRVGGIEGGPVFPGFFDDVLS